MGTPWGMTAARATAAVAVWLEWNARRSRRALSPRPHMIPAAPLPMQPDAMPADASLPAPVPAPVPAAARWQHAWRQVVRDPRQLLALLGLEQISARVSDAAAAQSPLRVPRGFIARMRHGDPHDPLLRQVLPLDDEDRIVPGFGLDAVGDGAAKTANGMLQKYRGRALLVATGSCAVNCRYCFRRH